MFDVWDLVMSKDQNAYGGMNNEPLRGVVGSVAFASYALPDYPSIHVIWNTPYNCNSARIHCPDDLVKVQYEEVPQDQKSFADKWRKK